MENVKPRYFYIFSLLMTLTFSLLTPVCQWRIQELSLPGAHGEGRAPNGVQEQNPWSGVRGRSPRKRKTFKLSNIQWKRQNCLVLSNLQSQ